MKSFFCQSIFALVIFSPLFTFGQIQNDYQEYLSKRQALLRKDSLSYFDHDIQLTASEKELSNKLSQLQHEMIDTYKDNNFFPPARNFYLSKTHIEQTPLYKILRKMPKGGILHLHSPAMGDARWIVEKAKQVPEMHVYWEEPNDRFIKGQLWAFKKGTAPKGFYPAQELAKREANFSDQLFSLLTFDQSIDRDSLDVWGEFEQVFQRINHFISYQPIALEYLTHGLELLVADNIQHAELRRPFRNITYDLDHPKGNLPEKDFIKDIEQLKDNIHQIDPDFTFNFIHINLRFRDEPTIWKDMQAVYEMRKKYPQWLRGYDLVANEDDGHSTLFHAQAFLRLDSLEKVHGVALPIYLHDGESCWSSVDNLYDAVLLGTKRIGHGFNLFRFPALLEEVRKQNICMEINPISNQVLGYIRDLRLHPASTYLRRGINCTISSDDPMIFDYQGLTYDYWSVFLAWQLDLAAIKKLSKNGILYSAMTDNEKTKALKIWESRWDKFVRDALLD